MDLKEVNMDLQKGFENFKNLIHGDAEKNHSIEKFLSEDFDIDGAFQTKINCDKKLSKLFKQPKTAAVENQISKLKEKIGELDDIAYHSDFIWGFCFEDLSKCDLSNVSIAKLLRIPFSTETKWPPKSKLPKGFDPKKILEKAKKFKGLGVEELHAQGITGKDVKVAYIDKGLDLSHEEFKDRKIEFVKVQKQPDLDFHGYSVLSRLKGKNIGIAPDVDCVYYACDARVDNGDDFYINEYLDNEFTALKDVVKRLKAGEKIVAVGLSASIPYHIYMAADDGKDKPKMEKLTKQYNKLVEELKKYGCDIFGSEEFWNKNFTYAFKQDTTKSDDDINNFVANVPNPDAVAVIDANKLTPLPYTTNGYKYENSLGSASWSIPQVLGLFCLAKQVDANLTMDEFAEIAQKTANEPNKYGARLINAVELVKEVKFRLKNQHEV